jgi:conjugal transfer mating pair stabilization protein TraG
MGTYVGGTMVVWLLVFKNQLANAGKWFLSYTILVTLALSPGAKVIINDSMDNAPRTVDNIPFLLAFGASITSSLGNGITQIVEQAFQPSPNEMVGGVGITGNSISSYSKTGFIFGSEVLKGMKKIAFTNTDIEQNMFSFVNQCVTYDAMIGRKYTLHDLKHSTDLWELVSKKASKLRGFPWREVTRTGSQVQSSTTNIITCFEGAQKIKALWGNITTSSLDDVSNKIGIGQIWKKSNSATPDGVTFNNQIQSYLPGALEKLTGKARAATESVKQQLMISSILNGSDQKSVELGGASNFEMKRAYFQQSESQKTIGHLIAQALPSVKNVLEAVLYCMFLFVLMMVFLPDGTKMLWFYFKVLIWLQLWAPLFAILNFIMTEALSWQAVSALKGADGITIGNFVGITNMSNDMASIAGYLSASIPMLSWMILEKGGYAFVSMASNLLGVSQSAASQAAAEKVSGNYNFGNTSFGNYQMGNASQLKQDFSASYAGGFTATNDGATSMLTAASGEKILHMQESHIPVSINVAKTKENSLRETQRDLYSMAESDQQSSSVSKQNAQNQYLEIGKQASHMLSQGKQFSDQEQGQVLKEASDHYNRIDQLSNKTGLSKEYLNQKVLEVSGGLSGSANSGGAFSLASLAADIGLRANKSEQSNMSSNQVAEEIFDMSKQRNMTESHQKMDTALKSKSLDTNNQELKQAADNFSSSYESSKRFEESASKSFEKAKSLDHEIAYTQNNAVSINAANTQAFVNKVGAENLKNMPLQKMSQKAQEFYKTDIQPHIETFLPKAKTTPSDLQNAYNDSDHGKKYATEDTLKQDHKTFQKTVYTPQKPMGVDKQEANRTQNDVNKKIEAAENKTNDALQAAKGQHVKAQQTFKEDHTEHAEKNMGLTQEGVVKDQHKNFEEKKSRN